MEVQRVEQDFHISLWDLKVCFDQLQYSLTELVIVERQKTNQDSLEEFHFVYVEFG